MSKGKVFERFCRSSDEAQALANFFWNEKERHREDIIKIENDLKMLREWWGVRPRKQRAFVRP